MSCSVAEMESPYPGILFRRFLDRDGRPVAPLPGFAQDGSALLPLYRAMVLTRTFDEKAVALQRTGRLGTYPSSLGQEAVTVGIGSAMRPDDVLLPSFREQGAQLWRGVGMAELLLYWGGDERGSNFAGPREDFPICIPVASHAPHAAGVALAFKLRGEERVAVCVMGDGGTSKGDFYESLNLAGVWHLPVVFVINNNQWAISVPRTAQTAAETLAQKGIAAGVEGIQVDGNDVIAVRDTVEQSLAKARSGGGSTLIEALTYRLGDHTTSDDASRYRDDTAVAEHWKDEPVGRLRRHLTQLGTWTRDDEEGLFADCRVRVEQAVADYLAMPPEEPATMFDHVYAALPDDLAEQRAAAIRAAIRGDGDA
jgi:2-oxoisovalerate dehydrogenase E1 component alpha subunit